MHPWFHQELDHLFLCMDEMNYESFLTDLLKSTFEQLTLEIGHPGQITDASYDKLEKIATDTWAKTAWNFASNHHFNIEMDIETLKISRECDQFLMQIFINHGISGVELIQLNQCRLFL